MHQRGSLVLSHLSKYVPDVQHVTIRIYMVLYTMPAWMARCLREDVKVDADLSITFTYIPLYQVCKSLLQKLPALRAKSSHCPPLITCTAQACPRTCHDVIAGLS